jgi:hypothetical protein
VTIEFEIGLFMLHIFALDRGHRFGPKSKMSVKRVF